MKKGVESPILHLQSIKQGGELGVEMGLYLSLNCYPLGEKGPSFHLGEGRAALFVEIEGQPQNSVRDLKEEVDQAMYLVD